MMNIVVVGGTGTLGNEIIRQYTQTEYVKLFSFSRDEYKAQKYAKINPNVTYLLGDIRDPATFDVLPEKIDVIFHVAALKHIDLLEENPAEAVRTNILGTMNLAQFALKSNVRYFVFSSTDKAVFPINVYGNTKAIAEKYLLDLNKRYRTRFSVFRWGNVIGSRGSVFDIFLKSIKEKNVIYLTDVEMTRFWIDIHDAALFMIRNYQIAPSDKAAIPPMKSSRVIEIGHAIAEVLHLPFNVEITGLRRGEKIHEAISVDTNSFDSERYTLQELCEMVRKLL